jgi:ABC-type transport system involved in cytochrome c biogenesis ATPase subunit
MLIRFLVKNLFSFQELTEFNLLPGNFKRLPGHVYRAKGVDLLKLNILYGANGAGKSNLLKALSLFAQWVEKGEMPSLFRSQTFKLDPLCRQQDTYLAVEFIKDDVPYYYGVTINDGILVEEELLISGLGKKEDVRLFLRTDSPQDRQLHVSFADEVMKDPESALFPAFLQDEMLERTQPVLYHMRGRKNPVFDRYKKAQEWFSDDLVTVMPQSRAEFLPLHLERNAGFKDFASQIVRAFHTGIHRIEVEKMPLEDYFGTDDQEKADSIRAKLKSEPNRILSHWNHFEEIVFVQEGEKAVAMRLSFLHLTPNGEVRFYAHEESDGTRRLMDYLRLFYTAIHSPKVFLVDEIERSIHPLLIKTLVEKFSHDGNTRGQVICTTHESNLLDQDIFRPDEIWFAEKNARGVTEIYPLSEFKEHHTIDIRKGYLNGRYGGIPFLGNLKDLNWGKDGQA